MTTQMTIFFDTPDIRSQFMRDIEGLLLYNDFNSREKEERMNYEDTLSFYMPDFDQEGCDPVKEPWTRMNLCAAEMALNPSMYRYFADKAK